MQAYVVAVGDELLRSDRTDTNSLWIAEALAAHGVGLCGKSVVGDRVPAIARAVSRALEEAEVVIVTGGLGPTADDLTREGVAEALGLELHPDESVANELRRRFAIHGVEMAEVNLRQALVPTGARVLENQKGSAPGLSLEVDGRVLFVLPGVPLEMQTMVPAHVVPWIAEHARLPEVQVQVFRVACLPESTVEERLRPLYDDIGPERVAVLARPGDVRVEVRTPAGEVPLDVTRMQQLMGDHIYSLGEPMPEVVVNACRQHKLTLALAESCTGGGVCRRLTGVPGASEVVLGGIVAYDNRIKEEFLRVRTRTLELHGAVSEETAVEMAEGVRREFAADLAVSVTGIAGPGGGTNGKPVGTVWFAWSDATGTDTLKRRFAGGRRHVRAQAEQWALDGIRRRIQGR